MKRTILIFVSLVALACSLVAQDIKGKYIIRSIEDGTILFIYPQEGYKSREMKSKLVYDLTYSSVSDSMTVNFTYINKVKSPTPLDSIAFVAGDSRYSSPASMLFIEPKKGDNWENRASARFGGDEFKALCAKQTPAQLILYIQGKEYIFEISEKNWKKNIGIITKVFDVAKYNF